MFLKKWNASFIMRQMCYDEYFGVAP